MSTADYYPLTEPRYIILVCTHVHVHVHVHTCMCMNMCMHPYMYYIHKHVCTMYIMGALVHCVCVCVFMCV